MMSKFTTIQQYVNQTVFIPVVNVVTVLSCTGNRIGCQLAVV